MRRRNAKPNDRLRGASFCCFLAVAGRNDRVQRAAAKQRWVRDPTRRPRDGKGFPYPRSPSGCSRTCNWPDDPSGLRNPISALSESSPSGSTPCWDNRNRNRDRDRDRDRNRKERWLSPPFNRLCCPRSTRSGRSRWLPGTRSGPRVTEHQSRSDIMNVAVGFQPTVQERRSESRRVATAEPRPRRRGSVQPSLRDWVRSFRFSAVG